MKMKKSLFIIPVILFGLLILFLWAGLGKETQNVPSVLIDKSVPDFTATDVMTGKPVSSREALQGKVSLVTVWATWCIPCLAEHQELLAIQKHYPIALYGINYKDDPHAAHQWLAAGNPYVVSWEDPNGKIGIEWGITGVPETFVVDAKGFIRFRFTGPLTVQRFTGQVLPVIASLHSEQ